MAVRDLSGSERMPGRKEATINALQRFEHKLEQLISGVFARAFRSAVQPVEITAALLRECDNNAQVLSRQRRVVPNEFHVELSQTDFDRIGGLGAPLQNDLAGQLQSHAEAQGYVFTGEITIGFELAEDLGTGRFRIRSKAVASVVDNDPHTRTRAAQATLEVNGIRHPLRAPGLVIGRGSEADLRINDPGVSRRHLEFEVGPDGIVAVDLGSTNGMRVNGAKVSRARLADGAIVKIANTEMTVHIDADSPAGHRDQAGGWNV